jgi:hypothetical protein
MNLPKQDKTSLPIPLRRAETHQANTDEHSVFFIGENIANPI